MLLYFISYLIAARVLIPACFSKQAAGFCRINKVIMIMIMIVIVIMIMIMIMIIKFERNRRFEL